MLKIHIDLQKPLKNPRILRKSEKLPKLPENPTENPKNPLTFCDNPKIHRPNSDILRASKSEAFCVFCMRKCAFGCESYLAWQRTTANL